MAWERLNANDNNEPDVRRDAVVSIMWDQYLQEHIDRGLSLPGAM